jgi:hypothetical protein
MTATLVAELAKVLPYAENDPGLVGALVVSHIEHSLSEIIGALEIPKPMDRDARRTLEFSLMGRPGFRALPRTDMRRVIEQLKNEDFGQTLRHAMLLRENGGQVGTSGVMGAAYGSSDLDVTDLRPFGLGEALDLESVPSPFESMTAADIQGVGPLKGFRLEETAETVQTPSRFAGIDRALLSRAEPSPLEAEIAKIQVPDDPIELRESLIGRDVRNQIALLRAGKVVAFVPLEAKEVISGGIHQIPVPNKRLYASLRFDDLLKEYHSLASEPEIEKVKPLEIKSEIELIDALLASLENEEQWTRINKRRFHLINKKQAQGLNPDEDLELSELQKVAQKRMYAAGGLPFAELARLEDYVRKLGFQSEGTSIA